MGVTDWEIVTNYSDWVGTSTKTFTFPKTQGSVKVTNKGNANLNYTIGSKTGTLTPNQSVTVNENISSYTLTAVSGVHTFEVFALEFGTEKQEQDVSVITSGMPKGGYRSIAIGDSITQGSSTVSNSIAGPEWFMQSLLKSNGKLVYTYNAGISGNTTAMMLSRIQTDVIAYKPDICFILGGTNDITGSTPATTIVSNIEKMVMVLLANKILPVLMTIPPRNTGDALLPLTENANILIRDLANKYALPCADIHSVLVDSSTGRYASGMSTDGLHPTIAGHGKISDAVVSSLSSWLYPRFPLLPVTNANNKNLLKNGLMDDTNADGVPENWFPYGSGAVTHSVLSDSSIKGKWNVMTCSANATGNRIMEQNISSGFNIGDKIAFVGRVATDFEAGSMTGGVDLLFTGTNARLSPLGGGSVGWSATVQSGVWYMERTVPEGTTQLKAQMVVGNGSGSLKVAQMGVYNLTQMGLA